MDGEKISQERLKQLLHYDPGTGIFTNRVTRNSKALKGEVSGWNDGHGYIRMSLGGHRYPAHRLAFLYVHGYMPENEIDHRNRRKSDNRFKNLREVSRQCNVRNTGNLSTNTSGIKGIYFSEAVA